VQFRDVSFTYPGNSLPTLNKINLRIEGGEFVVVTGGNSCGKTTLGKCINALVPYSTGGSFDGEVTVCGKDTAETETAELASRVGFVFSNPEDQLVTSTVRRELSFGLENLGIPREETLSRIERVCSDLDIGVLADRSVFNLSTGQMQLVAIAAFVVMGPEVLILDDPLSHLNRSVGKTVLRTIRDLYSAGTTIVWITQDVTDVFPLADRIVVLEEGSVAFDGATADFLRETGTRGFSAILPQHVEIARRLAAAGVDKRLLSPSLDEMIALLKRRLREGKGR